MAPRIVIIWVLVLQVFWIGVFNLSSRHFAPADQSKSKIAALKKRINHDAFVMAQMQINFGEYKDSVAAAGVRIDEETKWTDTQREVASVFADTDFKIKPDVQVWANREFEKGRKYFLSGNYQEATEVFERFIKNNSENTNLPQATYLLGESYVYLNENESALKAIDLLITQYPETELAGYAMVRLGKIFDQQSRPEEAAEMFNIVVAEYPKSNAALLAKKSLRELPL